MNRRARGEHHERRDGTPSNAGKQNRQQSARRHSPLRPGGHALLKRPPRQLRDEQKAAGVERRPRVERIGTAGQSHRLLRPEQRDRDSDGRAPPGREPDAERQQAAAAEQEQPGRTVRVPDERRERDPGGHQDGTGRES